MDNRLIFLYFVQIVRDSVLIVWPASVPAREYVSWKGYAASRCGVTEREDESVCIDWTWKAQGVESRRQIPGLSRAFIPIIRRKAVESLPFCFQENRRNRELYETVPQSNTGGVVE